MHTYKMENQGSIHNNISVLGFPNRLDFYDLITVLVLWQGRGELHFCNH